MPDSIDLTRAKLFARTWDIQSLIKDRANTEPADRYTYDEALDYLTQDEVIAYLDEQSEKLEKLYSRVPRHIIPMILLSKIATVSSASEASATLNAFSKWFSEAPPPSNREFLENMLSELREKGKEDAA